MMLDVEKSFIQNVTYFISGHKCFNTFEPQAVNRRDDICNFLIFFHTVYVIFIFVENFTDLH